MFSVWTKIPKRSLDKNIKQHSEEVISACFKHSKLFLDEGFLKFCKNVLFLCLRSMSVFSSKPSLEP